MNTSKQLMLLSRLQCSVWSKLLALMLKRNTIYKLSGSSFSIVLDSFHTTVKFPLWPLIPLVRCTLLHLHMLSCAFLSVSKQLVFNSSDDYIVVSQLITFLSWCNTWSSQNLVLNSAVGCLGQTSRPRSFTSSDYCTRTKTSGKDMTIWEESKKNKQ